MEIQPILRFPTVLLRVMVVAELTVIQEDMGQYGLMEFQFRLPLGLMKMRVVEYVFQLKHLKLSQ